MHGSRLRIGKQSLRFYAKPSGIGRTTIPCTRVRQMAMDIKREGVDRRKLIRRMTYLALSVSIVALASWRVDQLKPATPTVEIGTVWPDTVRRGPMVRDVRGPGT